MTVVWVVILPGGTVLGVWREERVALDLPEFADLDFVWNELARWHEAANGTRIIRELIR